MTFEEIRSQAVTEWEASENGDIPRVYISTASCGRESGSLEVLESIKAENDRRGLNASIIEVGCMGSCYLEPVISVAKPGCPRVYYGNVTTENAAQILSDYLVDNNTRPELAIGTVGEGSVDGIQPLSEAEMFKQQLRTLLRNCGYINPENINDYIANGGYSGLSGALGKTPYEVINEVEKSGLRGRGGGGYPTSTKWRACRDAGNDEKYVICNAHEGDPEVYLGRLLLESDPHSVIEGMIIAGYAVGANRGIIYLSRDNALAIERLRVALEQAKKYGLLGDNILGSGFSLDIEVKEGAPDFVCGEETAMIRSLEGRRAMPYQCPPFPAESGLNGRPTCINNLETLANVTAIFRDGAESFSGTGTGKSKGTKLLCLSGDIERSGIIEVPMGTTLRDIISDTGGGIRGGKEFKAALVGGPTGGFLKESALDTTVDFESLAGVGAIMGSGGIVVYGGENCIVDLTLKTLAFTQGESCGKCVMCREGSYQLLEILKDIAKGKSKAEELDLLLEVGKGINIGSLCGLGMTAPNPVITAIDGFREEFEIHARKKQCPANICFKNGS